MSFVNWGIAGPTVINVVLTGDWPFPEPFQLRKNKII